MRPNPCRLNKEDRLPPGWLLCPPYGQPIDHIIPSKLPLCKSFNHLVEPEKRYGLPKLISDSSKDMQIGLVISLTPYSGFCRHLNLECKGIKHLDIACKGIPNAASVNDFVYEVQRFLSDEEQNAKYILVHCTHGYNDTGYMMVHHLMRSTCASVTRALEMFALARPPGIFRQTYIDALYSFYHEQKPHTIVCPSIPHWRRRPLDLNIEPPPDDDYESEEEDPPLCRHEEIRGMKDSDVLGDAIPYDQQAVLREHCYRLLNLDTSSAKEGGCSRFPGTEPVFLTRSNFNMLRGYCFYISWKAVGTRYIMLVTRDGCYLIDRNFCIRRIQMQFPLQETSHHFTLLDGEMVIDTLPGTNKRERRYLASDLLAINNFSTVGQPFCERWEMIEKQVVKPRNRERDAPIRNANYKYDMEPFRVRRKNFWPLFTVEKLLNLVIPNLSHPADGLVFQRWDKPHASLNHGSLLKWQYNHSVYFLFEVNEEGCQQLFLLEKGKKRLMEGDRILFQSALDHLRLPGKIIECSWRSDKLWKSMRNRCDKAFPSDIETYYKVIRDKKNALTKEDLMKKIAENFPLQPK